MVQAHAPRIDGTSGWIERTLQTDRVTGLASRSAFDEALEAACAGATDEVSVLILHVSGAATVRSRYGSAEVDLLLGRAGDVVRAAIRGSDLAARVDDDDIGVVLPRTSLEDALRVARRIAHETERRNTRVGPHEAPIFFSFGAASGRACDPAELTAAADPRQANVAPDPPISYPGDPAEDEGPSVA